MNTTRQAGLFNDILPNQLIHPRSIEQSPKRGPKMPDRVPGQAAAEFSVQPLLYCVPGESPERHLPEGGQNVGFKVVVIEKTGGKLKRRKYGRLPNLFRRFWCKSCTGLG